MRGLSRKLILLIGDWVWLYISLFLLMLLRYGADWENQWDRHFQPFSLVFFLWILILYVSYLYESRLIRFNLETIRAIGFATAISVIASISSFYLFPPGLIYPRRNMALFAIIYSIVLILWRWVFYRIIRDRLRTNLIFIGDSPEIDELTQYIKQHPHVGYKVVGIIKNINDIDYIKLTIESTGAQLVVIKQPEHDPVFTKNILGLFARGISVVDLEDFYERVLNKVSPNLLNDLWFIKNLEDINLGVYQFGKRASDILAGIFCTLIFAILLPFLGLLIKLDSSGPVFIKQKRIGKNNNIFNLYKLRTMKVLGPDGSAETSGAKWAELNDERITRAGKLLRMSRFDELPQSLNILRGEMSLVGPRPERPEIVEQLAKSIPYYNMRHLVRPGMTGWAQINYSYGASIEDSHAKLKYDIYYVKERSLMLDIAIILKTIRVVLKREGR
jgi:exopolysaccharide biosynthesis polyprenyl glycosylphosphotransferase